MSSKNVDVLLKLRKELPKGIAELKPVLVDKKDERLSDREMFLKYAK